MDEWGSSLSQTSFWLKEKSKSRAERMRTRSSGDHFSGPDAILTKCCTMPKSRGVITESWDAHGLIQLRPTAVWPYFTFPCFSLHFSTKEVHAVCLRRVSLDQLCSPASGLSSHNCSINGSARCCWRHGSKEKQKKEKRSAAAHWLRSLEMDKKKSWPGRGEGMGKKQKDRNTANNQGSICQLQCQSQATQRTSQSLSLCNSSSGEKGPEKPS